MGRGPDGEELEAGDTYDSVETISDDQAPDNGCVEAVLVEDPPARPSRPVSSRAGLPLTEAVGRLAERADRQERRIRELAEVQRTLVAALVLLLVAHTVLLVLSSWR